MKRLEIPSRLLLLVAALLLGGSLATAAEPPPAPREGSFEGNWAVKGNVQQVVVHGARVTLARVEGKVTLRSGAGLAREFDALCNSVSDEKTGGVARCTWTDAAGDTLVLELSGSIIGPAGTVREAEGKVVGGTGRYADIQGQFHLDWLFVDSTVEDGRFTGYVTKLEGSWKRP